MSLGEAYDNAARKLHRAEALATYWQQRAEAAELVVHRTNMLQREPSIQTFAELMEAISAWSLLKRPYDAASG